MTLIQTYIVEKNDLIREGVKAFISGKNYKVVAEFKNIENAVPTSPLDLPQLIIIGINIRILSAYNAQEEVTKFKNQLERIRDVFPDSRLILLISQEALYHIPDLYSWNVDGYICRDITKEAFLNYLNLALMGERIIPAQLTAFNAIDLVSHHTRSEKVFLKNRLGEPVLSSRENDILRYIARGNANKVIAGQLNITESTVKVHIKTILRKLGVHNRTQAALWAMKNGLSDAAEHMALFYLHCLLLSPIFLA